MNKWLDAIMGVVVGDALGSPVQFHRRGEVTVDKMEPCENFNMPAGAWTDDSSLTIATTESIKRCGRIDLDDIADSFVNWLYCGQYTPFGQAYDIGQTCYRAIARFKDSGDVKTCGCTEESSNGNGSLMRIMPACLAGSVEEVEKVSALTHAHRRSQVGCGLYYYIVGEIIDGSGNLAQRLNTGLARARERYGKEQEFAHYSRLYDPGFANLPSSEIKSTGYVVHTLEAALWSLYNTESFREALLLAVNLGDDADSVGAVCGGLAGLYYGYDSIPEEWLEVICRREWIEGLLYSFSIDGE